MAPVQEKRRSVMVGYKYTHYYSSTFTDIRRVFVSACQSCHTTSYTFDSNIIGFPHGRGGVSKAANHVTYSHQPGGETYRTRWRISNDLEHVVCCSHRMFPSTGVYDRLSRKSSGETQHRIERKLR